MSKVGNYRIPYNKHTKQPLVEATWWDDKNGNVEWRDNEPFVERLEYSTFMRSDHSVYLLFTGLEGGLYPMFLSEFDKIMQGEGFNSNSRAVLGEWMFTKRGTRYGVRLIRTFDTYEAYRERERKTPVLFTDTQ